MEPDIDGIIAQAFPNEDRTTLAWQRGQFYDVILGKERAVSVARTSAAADRILFRAAMLESINRLGPDVPIPRIVEVHPTYLVMTRLHGTTLDLTSPGAEPQRLGIIEELSRLLLSLWQIDQITLSEVGLETKSQSRWSDFAQDCVANLFPLMSAEGKRRAGEELDAVLAIPRIATHLIHGDLGGSNLLWAPQPHPIRLAGVLDWDEAHIGDPAEDLAALQATFGDDVLAGILANVGQLHEARSRIEAIRGTFALQQAISAFQDGDETEMADGIREYV